MASVRLATIVMRENPERQLSTVEPNPEHGHSHVRQSTAQRSTLTVNHGRYYLDTTVIAADQSAVASNLNVFDPDETYYTFLLYAKPSTEQTYDLYVGPGFNSSTDVFAARADISGSPTQFTPDQWPATWRKQYDSNSGVQL